jgi:flagellin
MVVQHNMQAMNANRQLGITTSQQSKSTEKLSSGYRINRAADDAAGLTISEKMRNQIRGLNKASSNAQDGVSLIQTAEGALNETHSILQRMNELATQAANDTNTTSDRNAIQSEMNQLASEINRIQSTTQFNTQNLLDGSFTGKNLQVGSLSGQKIALSITSMSCGKLFASGAGTGTVATSHKTTEMKVGSTVITAGTKTTLTAGQNGVTVAMSKTNNKSVSVTQVSITATTAMYDEINVASFSSAGNAMTFIQAAIERVSAMRSTLGAVQNRLEHTIANLDTTAENTQSAESQIRDTDMADEMVTYSKNNILAQAGQSMLAQANQSTQGVLSLLG